MFQIRNLQEKDRKTVEHICIETASADLKKSALTREFTLQMYNRYYTRTSKEHCFVAVNAQDEAVGYILCAPQFQQYFHDFCKQEVKEISKRNPIKGLYAVGAAMVQLPFKKAYPAHLHIDILEPYQHQGIGKALMQTLKTHLKSIGCKGIFLSVDKGNTNAVAFYKRNGFSILMAVGGAYCMGCTL